MGELAKSQEMQNTNRGESNKRSGSGSTSRVSRRGNDENKQKHDISYLLNQGRGHHRSDDKAGASKDHREGRGGSSSGSGLSPSEVKRWCDICKKLFAQPADLKKHHKCVHLKERPFRCDHCPATFGEKGNLNRHVKSVHDKERPWICPQCGLPFAFRDTLTRHVNAVHDDIRPYQCDVCLSNFKKRDHLHRHQEAVHGKKRK